ncbi:AsnC family protein, partial [Mycobacterium sp. NAZ190054]|uniref:AsnC family protein n=1 Tax=Mycobacterium sp. NAZ190054 TaxID=1747766 RepID=UPI000B02EEDF
MDEVDEAIVELLELDGRLTHRDIARRVGLSRSAAAARVQRLHDGLVDLVHAVGPLSPGNRRKIFEPGRTGT